MNAYFTQLDSANWYHNKQHDVTGRYDCADAIEIMSLYVIRISQNAADARNALLAMKSPRSRKIPK